MPTTPKSILYIRPDTFGDLVLFHPTLFELLRRFPDARHNLLVRVGYESLQPLFPPGLRWITTPIHPYKMMPEHCRADFALLLATLRSEVKPDLILAATCTRTWLETALAQHLPDARRLALGPSEVDLHFSAALAREHATDSATAFPERIPLSGTQREWRDNYQLVTHLCPDAPPAVPPTLTIPSELQLQARQILAAKNLSGQRWAAVFPGGTANVALKAWPAENFAELCAQLSRQHAFPILLLGHESERTLLENIRAALAASGQTPPEIWLGQNGEIALLAALLAESALYVGNDTGAMHLAAALGRPTVGIFGGGTWPRFQPAGRQTASVVQPLACFGCQWDCFFENAPCLRTIPVSAVADAVSRLLQAGDSAQELVIEAKALGSDAVDLIARCAPRFRARENERLDARQKLRSAEHALARKDQRIAELERAADQFFTAPKPVPRTSRTAARPRGWTESIAGPVRHFWQESVVKPVFQWLYEDFAERYWMKIGTFHQYTPQPVVWDRLPSLGVAPDQLPRLGYVTPSYNQADYLEETLRSILDQRQPAIHYAVQDGGSTDASAAIIARHAARLEHWESAPDRGQADAILKGFRPLMAQLRDEDIMAWINSDDLVAPGAALYVAEYFARHPEVDVVYGHRIVIDENSQEIGRWILPPHDAETLHWGDFVPQETLYWRKRIWEQVGGLDPTFHFALDWDLLVRFQEAGAKIVRLPYHLGAFRAHEAQKTIRQMDELGHQEMVRIRRRFNPEQCEDRARVDHFTYKTRLAGAFYARLGALGIRR